MDSQNLSFLKPTENEQWPPMLGQSFVVEGKEETPKGSPKGPLKVSGLGNTSSMAWQMELAPTMTHLLTSCAPSEVTRLGIQRIVKTSQRA